MILKIHGAIDRLRPERDSYVITEDNYIDYLTRTDVSTLMPVTLGAPAPATSCSGQACATGTCG